MALKQGSVKWFSESKGYGFIREVSGDEIFFHKTGIANKSPIQKGDRVQFEIAQSPKGMKAQNIVVV